jgi:NAD(P)-dependent dehydrogenase (short-subunit alcohol dehydrogenase family)
MFKSDMNIIVTGCSRGIGSALAKILVGRNHRVWGLARSIEKLKKIKNELGQNFQFTATDITDFHDIQNAFEEISSKWSAVHGLVNNAGLLINKPFLKQSSEDWEKQISVNLTAPVQLIKSFYPLFYNAHVVNISSMGGFQGSSKFPGLSAYSSAKGGLSILTECLQAELGGEGHTFNALCLGAVHTEMLETAFPGFEPELKPEAMAEYLADFLLKGHQYFSGKILPVAQNDPGY